ncbi:MAG: FAD-dependent oxidoreductase [Patescibacteria group bacterium]
MNNQYDVIIVGGGPAGLTASIYASRRNLKTLVIAKGLGGQMAMTNEIENYPGLDLISGADLAQKMQKQAEKWETKFDYNEVVAINKVDQGFIVKTNKDDFEARAVILAFGLTPRDLGVPGEEKLKGRGVAYCATCDGPFYKNKIVGVVGGGNAALESAIYLSGIAKKAYLIYFSPKFNAEGYLVAKAKAIKNIEFLCCAQVKEIKGDKKVESVILADIDGQTKSAEIKLDGLFIEIGYQAKTGWLKGFVDLNERGEIMVNRDGETSVPGVFAAGDCADSRYKQIVISAGEGAKTALQAYKYIVATSGGRLLPDWGKSKKIDGNILE